MLWLKRVKAKLKGADEFYADLRTGEIPAYQELFERTLRSIDIETETAWSRGEKYNKARFEKDEETINLICEQAEQRGLNPGYLIIMVHQYVLADPWQRERDEKQWANRVVRRKEIDYFPSGWATHTLLERMH